MLQENISYLEPISNNEIIIKLVINIILIFNYLLLRNISPKYRHPPKIMVLVPAIDQKKF